MGRVDAVKGDGAVRGGRDDGVAEVGGVGRAGSGPVAQGGPAAGGVRAGTGTYARGARFLRERRWVVAQIAFWSVLETGQTFLTGYALARALDDGFLAGRGAVGLGWLLAAAGGVLVAAYGTGKVFRAVARLVEPMRDALVRHVVARGIEEADSAAVSRLTQQVETARDTFAGLVMVSRSFVFTAVGALIGLCTLAPLLVLVVAPPLVAGVGLFILTLRPLARRQEDYLAADEAIATELGAVCPGLRDVTAAGAEEPTAAAVEDRLTTEYETSRTLARWSVVRIASLALGGQLPIVLLLATGPWLLSHDVTAGELVGALTYVTQALLPALHNLVHGLGSAGTRLVVILRRLVPEGTGEPGGALPPPEAGAEAGAGAGVEAGVEAGAEPETTGPSLTKTPTGPTGPTGPTEPIGPTDLTSSTDLTSLTPPPTPPPALHLTSVTFAYGPHAEPVIRDLDLVLPRGGHLAVVGPSGVGKSTLAGLVAGMLAPGSGSVRVAGRDARDGRAVARRVLIPQEAYVFGGTLGENLRYLRQDPVPDAELLDAAHAVGLGPLAERVGGLGARLDPAALSAGERQLIALTRAYVAHAELAVLDEATCHLDPEAESRAERAFAARPGGTLVVVAHRISSARRADRVLVLDGPRTDCGRHGELLKRSELYRDLAGNWNPAAASQPVLP
ncbi:ATP-binding cassette domain-containing protein [Streptomyces sp. NPDC127108]|uniref:ATP-binding cassette domain-containing protein n=1 Tax=Streptomyces sp. NPDC127108 TaxID=3345361 RepID=UPI00362AD7A7